MTEPSTRITRQYTLVFTTSSPLTNRQADALLDVAESLILLGISPIGVRRYQFSTASNANHEEFMSVVRTLIAPNTYTVVSLVSNPLTRSAS